MVQVDPMVYLLAALLLLTLPLDWFLAALIAAAVHELWHLAALYLLGGKVHSLRIGAGGAVIDADVESRFREFLSALAGPAGSFFLLSLYRHAPKLAICAGIQGAFNLLPIYPLDGGRMLRYALERLCPKLSEKSRDGIETGITLLIAAAAMAASFACSLGLVPIAGAWMLILKVFQRKRPCKQRENRVQ